MINKILIAAFLAIVASSSFAADLTVLDTDKDGLVSKDEASISPAIIEQWDILDTNQDGYLDEAELAAFGEMKDDK